MLNAGCSMVEYAYGCMPFSNHTIGTAVAMLHRLLWVCLIRAFLLVHLSANACFLDHYAKSGIKIDGGIWRW